MRLAPFLVLTTLIAFVPLAMQGCDPEVSNVPVQRSPKPSPSPTLPPESTVIATNSSFEANSVPSPSPFVAFPQPSFVPAASQSQVLRIDIQPSAAKVSLCPPAATASMDLGLPYQQQYTAAAIINDGQGTRTEVAWTSLSTYLTVDQSGLVSVVGAPPEGVYYVRVSAVADPGVFMDLPVQVLNTSQLEVTVQ